MKQSSKLSTIQFQEQSTTRYKKSIVGSEDTHNNEVIGLYDSPDIVRTLILRRMGKEKTPFTFLIG